MKTDDFEKQLKERALRNVPPQWREEILEQARKAAERAPAAVEGPGGLRAAANFWRELLWPSPKAWGALACIWVLLALANHEISGLTPPSTTNGPGVRLTPETIAALKEQRKLRAELFETADSNSTTAAPVPKPRTSAEGQCSHA